MDGTGRGGLGPTEASVIQSFFRNQNTHTRNVLQGVDGPRATVDLSAFAKEFLPANNIMRLGYGEYRPTGRGLEIPKNTVIMPATQLTNNKVRPELMSSLTRDIIVPVNHAWQPTHWKYSDFIFVLYTDTINDWRHAFFALHIDVKWVR